MHLRLHHLLLSSACLLFPAACSAPTGNGPEPQAVSEFATGVAKPAEAPLLPSIRPEVTRVVADPSLEGFAGIELSFTNEYVDPSASLCSIEVLAESDSSAEPEVVAVLNASLDPLGCSATWSGISVDGTPYAPASYIARAQVTTPTGEVTALLDIGLVRVRIRTLRPFARGDGERYPYLYRSAFGLRDGYHEILADAETLRTQEPTPPTPWEDLTRPPEDEDGEITSDEYNLPSLFRAGSEVGVEVELTVQGLPPEEITLVAPSGYEIDSAVHADEATVYTLVRSETPVPGVGRYDETLSFTFADGATTAPLSGVIAATQRYYGILEAPVFDFDEVPYRAWLDVVDRVAGWVDGEFTEEADVARVIVEGIYYDLDLRYDSARGASFYTAYPRSYRDGRFDLTAFQNRDNGDVINCSDASGILSIYANMVGIDFRYHILLHESQRGFDLNFIRAIGTPEFSETPFDGGGGAFSYHAIVGPPSGATFDATLALDGDGDPLALPSMDWLADGLDLSVYLAALSSEWQAVVSRFDERMRFN